jgi:hypothetical protein
MNLVLRILLLVWVIGYLVGSCSPILNGHFVLGTIALLGGLFLFIPWVIGIIVLWFLIQATNPPRR